MPPEDHSSDRSDQGLPQGGVELSLDELSKELATGTLSRGKAIRWMGGALLGAALASFPGVAWANDCRRLGRECRRDSQCCSRNCIRRGDDKVCGCPEGKTRCNDRCVNLERNENHCGSCFNRCEEGEECVDSACTPTCAQNGSICSANDQCCSGRCAGGMCAEPCPSDRVLLCNGTCARRCTSSADCAAGCEGCGGEISTGLRFCGRTDPAQTRCSTCSDCPTGQFCHAFGTEGICDFAC
jgi:hypothetical protein